jgi:putrescine aminotransferase
MRAVRDSMIISPPLTITRDEVDMLIAIVEKTLDDTLRSLQQSGHMPA